MHIEQMIKLTNPTLTLYDHIPRIITSSKLISPTAKLVFGALLKYAPDHRESCWPGISQLAKDVGMNRKSVMLALSHLENAGLLEKTARQDANGTHSNLYTLLPFPEEIITAYMNLCNIPIESDQDECPDPTIPSPESTPPPSRIYTRSSTVREVKDCQPAPSVPLASLATQTPRAGGVEPLGGASAKPKSPPIDPNVVITKIREAKDGVLELDSKECWTACLAIWESLYEKKMTEADKKMFGGIIKDTSLELVGRTFVDLLDGDTLPPDWPYIIQCVGNLRNKDAYRQVKKDHERIYDAKEVYEIDQKHGLGSYFKQYFEELVDSDGHPIRNSKNQRQYRQLKPIIH